ncbi:TIGR02221 family CRISPR-associated protein [Aquisalimonas sp.]|uniref:TIGR02221 family CRISPR-associated protein n=1 Tax=Aquisalimonas sp. TaxID=1872621 RepID=UPI0025B7D5AF|nr:TIGR02221 family CRISPR-associated protein [Aquisalimonas sp.]
MHTLVSFLGRSERPADGYRCVRYDFPDGFQSQASFVGYSLVRKLRPDRLVIVGTAGSMWDQLLTDGAEVQAPEGEAEALMESVDEARTSQAQLDALAPLLASVLDCDVVLRAIPEALDDQGQTALLSALVEATEGSNQLSLDITHGYRHLPMLMLMAALYLRSLRSHMEVRGIWYAMLHAAEGRASVQDVSGVLHFADWISALQRSELTGDYSKIATLIADDEVADALRNGGFLETIHRAQQARGLLKKARARLQERPLQGPGALFQPILERDTRWVEHQRLDQRQRAHAISALERGDFLRSALYGYEAFVTRLVHQQGEKDVNKQEVRQDAKRAYEANGSANPDWWAYKQLRGLRNVLAHGNRADTKEVESALQSPDTMRAKLSGCLDTLLPEAGNP